MISSLVFHKYQEVMANRERSTFLVEKLYSVLWKWPQMGGSEWAPLRGCCVCGDGGFRPWLKASVCLWLSSLQYYCLKFGFQQPQARFSPACALMNLPCVPARERVCVRVCGPKYAAPPSAPQQEQMLTGSPNNCMGCCLSCGIERAESNVLVGMCRGETHRLLHGQGWSAAHAFREVHRHQRCAFTEAALQDLSSLHQKSSTSFCEGIKVTYDLVKLFIAKARTNPPL